MGPRQWRAGLRREERSRLLAWRQRRQRLRRRALDARAIGHPSGVPQVVTGNSHIRSIRTARQHRAGLGVEGVTGRIHAYVQPVEPSGQASQVQRHEHDDRERDHNMSKAQRLLGWSPRAQRLLDGG